MALNVVILGKSALRNLCEQCMNLVMYIKGGQDRVHVYAR